MKKILTLSIVSLMFVSALQIASAQGKASAQGGAVTPQGTQQRIQDPSLNDEAIAVPQGSQQGQMGQQPGVGMGMNQGLGVATQSLNRVAERANNPEIGQQVRTMVESHQQIQTKNQEAIKTMSQRNNALKFFLGPDYKNAGQVRSNIVSLRNDISQLEALKEDATEEDVEDIQLAIDELQTEAEDLDSQLEEQLSGFSLFGWLARRFAN